MKLTMMVMMTMWWFVMIMMTMMICDDDDDHDDDHDDANNCNNENRNYKHVKNDDTNDGVLGWLILFKTLKPVWIIDNFEVFCSDYAILKFS